MGDGRVHGVELRDGTQVRGDKVILTTGTFLAGVMCIVVSCAAKGVGLATAPATALSHSFIGLRFAFGRLKTGTTPRLDGRTIHWDRLEPQADTDLVVVFFCPNRASTPAD